MAITITWGTKTINIPKADTVLLQSTPTEIRQLDLNQFRLTLGELQDTEEGISHPPTHRHTAPLDVGQVTLARTIEIFNGYTVTFEDGNYTVDLVGANSNIADNVNANQVTIRPENSAGLISNAAVEFAEYQGGVYIDTGNTTGNASAGSIYPIGTLRKPSSNVTDANVIVGAKGLSKMFVIGDITLSTGDDVSGLSFIGEHPLQTTITINTGGHGKRLQVPECYGHGNFGW